MVKLLYNEGGVRTTGEVNENHLEVYESLECAHECHGLTRSGWATQKERSMLTQPPT
jgi:hypothetical protein